MGESCAVVARSARGKQACADIRLEIPSASAQPCKIGEKPLQQSHECDVKHVYNIHESAFNNHCICDCDY